MTPTGSTRSDGGQRAPSFASHPDPESVPLRDAATVMMVRDGVGGLEVCMLQRNLNSDFVGGAYVFPGGGVDPGDSAAEVAAICDGRDDPSASLAVGVPSGGLAFWVAAIRESFEEAGVLLAHHPDGSVVSFADPVVSERFSLHRKEVDSGRRSLVEICAEEDLRLGVDQMHYFSRWVTPLGAPRRYDTRFFLAAAPPGQQPLADDREVIDSVWIRPQDALAEFDAGRMTMIFPTIRTMIALEHFDSATAVLEHARSQGPPDAVVPMLVDEGGGLRLRLPGDPEQTGGLYDPVTGAVIES